jgi:metal-responsive CopG/Arc/MetJ family transcriptional regulator
MHVHAYYHAGMRTTVEIKDELRAKLLSLAAKRKLKGFSPIVEEALEEYLSHDSDREQRIEKAIKCFGAWEDRKKDSVEIVKEMREDGDRKYADRH